MKALSDMLNSFTPRSASASLFGATAAGKLSMIDLFRKAPAQDTGAADASLDNPASTRSMSQALAAYTSVMADRAP